MDQRFRNKLQCLISSFWEGDRKVLNEHKFFLFVRCFSAYHFFQKFQEEEYPNVSIYTSRKAKLFGGLELIVVTQRSRFRESSDVSIKYMHFNQTQK